MHGLLGFSDEAALFGLTDFGRGKLLPVSFLHFRPFSPFRVGGRAGRRSDRGDAAEGVDVDDVVLDLDKETGGTRCGTSTNHAELLFLIRAPIGT